MKCQICEKDFPDIYSTAKFCSKECREEYERAILREHREQAQKGRHECLNDIRDHGLKFASVKYGKMTSENWKSGRAASFFRSAYRRTLIGDTEWSYQL